MSGSDPKRPNKVLITTGGVTTTLVDPLASISGPEWDHIVFRVTVPAGATDLSVQVMSEPDGTTNKPASLAWIGTVLDLVVPHCGDGVLRNGECDDGNQVDTDACGNDCVANFCGDGQVNNGEACDDGNQFDTDACGNDCIANFCGDGQRNNGEACDDGNQVDTDACGNDCVINFCGDGEVNNGEACDDGNQVDDDACSNDCISSTCGDGIVINGEACDGEVRFLLALRDGAAAPMRETRTVLMEIDRSLEPRRLIMLRQYVDYATGDYRATATLAGALGVVGLVLTIVGVYGVTAYRTSKRTREFGIRSALGALRSQVLALVLRETFVVIALGLGLGCMVSLWTNRVLESLLLGIKPWDPWSLSLTALILATGLLLATIGPALRAASVNPIEALRDA